MGVRSLDAIDDLRALARLFSDAWGGVTVPVPHELLRALAHTGNYVAGAFEGGGTLVGGSMAFLGGPEPVLHSHITAVVAPRRGTGVGLALKQHQRAWAAERGIATVTWTFDPLVRRNAWFNLSKLGAVGVGYLPDFYGAMDDGINAGDQTDRLLVRWDVAGSERAADGVEIDLEVPDDIESLRRSDPDAAAEWRRKLRAALAPAVAGGARVVGMSRSGRYRVLAP